MKLRKVQSVFVVMMKDKIARRRGNNQAAPMRVFTDSAAAIDYVSKAMAVTDKIYWIETSFLEVSEEEVVE